MSHTPGPWQWYWRTENDETNCGVFWEKSKGQAWPVCRAPRYQTEEQWTADARLISAAPDLLVALNEAVGYLRDDAYSKACKAITKATGEVGKASEVLK